MSEHTHAHSTGGIRRGPRLADNFTILSNAVVNDGRLSFRARGLLVWLLSKPADWRIRSESIAAQSPREGREAIRTAMRELEQHGYLVREKVQDERGRWATIQTVYEEPATCGDTPPDPKPRKSDSGEANPGELGALTKDGSPRTETNHHPGPRGSAPLGDVLGAVSSSQIAKDELRYNRQQIADLEAATLAAGLPASYQRIKPAQKTELLRLIDVHGVDALAAAAAAAHRPMNPTMHVHGWLRLWQALPAPRAAEAPPTKCDQCDEYGWLPDDEDGRAVMCPCGYRTATSLAA
ncbi:replication protein [Rhodococcus aetherivorans]|uniref:replication protein n=1 Tax=Rhodococcus aetherivorans TaxID=191292 RepID=UPI00388D28BE